MRSFLRSPFTIAVAAAVLLGGGAMYLSQVLPAKRPVPVVTPIQQPTDAPKLQRKERIRVTTPKKGERIRSPLVVKGEARGNWYFEASFPVALKDSAGTIIARGIASAIGGEWMTEAFVPFEATLKFPPPKNTAEGGILILEKDNPSGLPENDAKIEIPILFATAKAVSVRRAAAPCFVGGCSREICSDTRGIISACLYSPEFACYKTAVCERQKNSECGWTESTKLGQCIADAKGKERDIVF